MTKEWLLARLKEGSTKWGIAITVVLVALFIGPEQLGEWKKSLTEAVAILGALRLVMTQEAPHEAPQ